MLIEFAALLTLVLAALAVIQATLLKPFRVPSASMMPTLLVGQRVLVNRFIYDIQAPGRGDIVVFHPPSPARCATTPAVLTSCAESFAATSGRYYVKRILGLPGDRIAILDGHPVINGRELTHEPYTIPCPQRITICELPHAITVPRGYYFVIGDNRPNSLDSREFGPIPASAIIGQVFFTYWPPDRIGTS